MISDPENGAAGVKQDVFTVKFEATFRNTSDHAILVAARPVMPDIPEILLPSGEWKAMMLSKDIFETGDDKYPPCTKVKPSQTITFPNVGDIIVLERDRPANQRITVRFHFYNICVVGSARRSTSFVTEGVRISP